MTPFYIIDSDGKICPVATCFDKDGNETLDESKIETAVYCNPNRGMHPWVAVRNPRNLHRRH